MTENNNITLHDGDEDVIMNIRWLLEGLLLPTCGVMGLIGINPNYIQGVLSSDETYFETKLLKNTVFW